MSHTQRTAQHTPGPWRKGDAGQTIFGPKTDQPAPVAICLLSPASARAGYEEREANGRLIAAAPELLRVLKLLVTDAKHKGVEPVLIGMAEDEIFKAEGGK